MHSRRGAYLTALWATSFLPLLWKKVRRGLSAGRVQSVAVRLVLRPRARSADFRAGGILDDRRQGRRDQAAAVAFHLAKISGEKAEIGNGETAEKILAETRGKNSSLVR